MTEELSAGGATTTARFTPLSGGNGVFVVFGGSPRDLSEAGYFEIEFAASGTATSFVPIGELTADGCWSVRPDATADFATRVLVRCPADPAAFNGTVVVEWFNVTVGMDTGAHFSVVADEILRGGYAYVGVSAQQVGIMGGTAAIAMEGMEDPVGLRATDPERYGSLRHPGDGFSYDIYTQIGRALRGPDSPLAGLAPERFIAAGQSQSAFRMVSYVNAMHPSAAVFDGFYIHSRGRSAASLDDGGEVSEALSGPPVRIRTDLTTPVLMIEAEGDLVPSFSYAEARQPDDDHIRLWEMAGTAHADRYTVGTEMADLIPSLKPINAGPAHYILASALRQLTRWVAHGEPPAIAPRIEIAADGSVVRDEHGNARGGIRTPLVDVPVATLSGDPVGDDIMFQLFGSTTTFEAARLRELYGDRDSYLAAFDQALDRTVAAGWVLQEDRAEMAAEARRVGFP